MTAVTEATTSVETSHGRLAVVVLQELRDLWALGRGLPLLVAYSLLLGVIGWLAASNQALNFLEQRETVGLLVQVAVGVGALLVLLAAADAVSGERERGTLETLLLTPARRVDLTAGKLLASLSLWVAALAVAVPYVWVVGRGVGVVGNAVGAGLLVGTLLSLFVGSLGLSISILSTSNRVSLSVSLFVLLALLAPTQLPTGAQHGWLGDLILHANPFTSGLRFVGRVVVDGQPWIDEATWLLAPAVAATVLTVTALLLGARALRLRSGSSG